MHTVHNARVTLLATVFNNLALAVIVAGFIAPAASGQLRAGWQAVTTLSLGSSSELPYMSAGKSCSGGCGSNLGPSVDLADLAGDPDGRHLCRRHLGVAIHPVTDCSGSPSLSSLDANRGLSDRDAKLASFRFVGIADVGSVPCP